MDEKKEIQQTIEKPSAKKIDDEEFYSVLKIVSPGTKLRRALDGILHYGKGALIAIENNFLPSLIDGGFKVNCKFTYQKLMELSKMDGAIILSKDLKRIIYANVLLTPNNKIHTSETGTRHKAAERTARQISGLAISISEKRNEITLYYKNRKHLLQDLSEIVRRFNENLQILERQRDLFNNHLDKLNKLELRNYINLNHAIKTIQRGKIIQEIAEESKRYLIELGSEGALLKTRVGEILADVDTETNLIIKDYSNTNYKESIQFLDNLSYEELLDSKKLLRALNHESMGKIVNVGGWRILSKTTLTNEEISNLIKEAKNFEKIIASEIEDENGFQSLTKDKFSLLKVELERIKLGL